ncbi:MAG: hypothetical protein ACRDWA_17110 [Acidimicrobiia bacterium]
MKEEPVSAAFCVEDFGTRRSARAFFLRDVHEVFPVSNSAGPRYRAAPFLGRMRGVDRGRCAATFGDTYNCGSYLGGWHNFRTRHHCLG